MRVGVYVTAPIKNQRITFRDLRDFMEATEDAPEDDAVEVSELDSGEMELYYSGLSR